MLARCDLVSVLIVIGKWLALVLAIYRISFELAFKPGPFNIFFEFRRWAVLKSEVAWVEDWVSCPVCLSFLISIGAAILFFWGWSWMDIGLVGFSLSGAIQIIHYAMVGIKSI